MKIENDQIHMKMQKLVRNVSFGGKKKMQGQTSKFSNENHKQGHVITKTWF